MANLRLNYLLDRAKAMDLPRVWRMAGNIGRDFRKPRAVIFADMLWSATRYECAFQDYQDWDFAILSPAERRTFATHPKSNHYSLMLNTDKTANAQLSNKLNFNVRFEDVLGREWLDIREADDQALKDFLDRHADVMAKVPDSLGGKGIERIRRHEVTDLTAFRRDRMRNRQFLLEEFLVQHPDLAKLNSSSVNTMRIVSYNDGTKVHILATALRIGAGGDVDNFSGGGMYTMLSPEGVALYPAFDDNNATHGIHPLSGVPIVGFRVPLFAEALDAVQAAAQRIPEVPFVGWDVAIAPNRPVLIEGNYNTGVFQAKPTVSGLRKGLLPVYRAAIGR
ncbi:hypothetical protein EG850_01400 [Gulosibacter macacae]|uniref:Alpha-L-glutamate ligase-related protein ATP-grasp domain-containing protein n=1 Tax=Gulosibacter macacae TaxID=2488791 RepID=A0A3P3W588_9MICO|nr:sugar-transfer associated ATP-grasp domain-containing protein [Gulosibacter macacae]RRJ88819.1 hypothetical protein EG850_01400 [Gulosibacter macacae]